MEEWDIYEKNPENCDYMEVTYKEYDTGYEEWGCNLIDGDARHFMCCEDGCPLTFRAKEVDNE